MTTEQMQQADLILGGDMVRTANCNACGRLFQAQRRDSLYCSNACRQRAYRHRVTDSASECNNPLEIEARRMVAVDDISLAGDIC